MKDMYEDDCEYIFMEVSSHALEQERVSGIKFKAALFTNITHDHLDYHLTFLNYINAKKKFFDNLEKSSLAIINNDDKNGKVMVQNCIAKILTYGLHSLTDYRCKVLNNDISGLHLKINNHEVMCALSGEFNAYNILAVYTAAVELGEDAMTVLSILSRLQGAEGRMQKVLDKKTGKVGIIDYAHTPDALENVLKTLKASIKKTQQIITVVGCGGDRDKTKRPIMARIAAELSDGVVFTSDNPRSEDAQTIIDEMAEGLTEQSKPKCLRVVDRANAIKVAVKLANPNDVILVAGKGHEKYQEIKGEKFPFEDKKILLEVFEGNF
jgi:UDP-N-acetylmuramoyl-L-alanyl-D-glutamate--2,6-diaminopimelate ligase